MSYLRKPNGAFFSRRKWGLLGGAPDVAARPLLCAPLESVEFMRAAAISEEAS